MILLQKAHERNSHNNMGDHWYQQFSPKKPFHFKNTDLVMLSQQSFWPLFPLFPPSSYLHERRRKVFNKNDSQGNPFCRTTRLYTKVYKSHAISIKKTSTITLKAVKDSHKSTNEKDAAKSCLEKHRCRRKDT